MNIRYPQWMPNPQPDSYTYQAEDRRRKTDMEMGSLYRKEFDTDETTCSCSIVLDEFQSNFFEAFERDVLQQGSKWFEFPLLVGGEISYHLVRFTQRPKMTNLIGATKQEYTLSLMVSKRITMSGDFAGIITVYSPEDIMEFSASLHQVLHIEIPNTLEIPAWRDYNG